MLHPQEYYSNTHQLFIKCASNEMNHIYYNALKYGVTLNTKEKNYLVTQAYVWVHKK